MVKSLGVKDLIASSWLYALDGSVLRRKSPLKERNDKTALEISLHGQRLPQCMLIIRSRFYSSAHRIQNIAHRCIYLDRFRS